MGQIDLTIQTYNQEGDLTHSYSPLRNLVGNEAGHEEELKNFEVQSELGIDLQNPVNIECQPSFDGTVNLILNDDKNPPRIINTRFSKTEDNRYKIIDRNQIQQTNLYKEGQVDQQTRLFRNITTIPRIDLLEIYNMGNLPGGNYNYYVKFADCDFNKTDFVCESSEVSVFKGHINRPSSISGTIFDERTDKAVTIQIKNIDQSFSYVYLYFSRSYCDLNGVKLTEFGMYSSPYAISGDTLDITLTGYEDVTEISEEELNIQYNIITAAKTQAQVQNMLFLGNIQSKVLDISFLQNIAYFFKVTLKQSDSIGWVNPRDYSINERDDSSMSEYYSPFNIYYKLGYWPDEMYRLGVVFINKDDSLSPVFNLRGCNFTDINTSNIDLDDIPVDESGNPTLNIPRDQFLPQYGFLANSFGVFRNPSVDIIDYTNNEVKPLYYEISLGENCINLLKKEGVKGYFIVRQKRLPTTVCQGFSVGTDKISYSPMLWDGEKYIAESFLGQSRLLNNKFQSHLIKATQKQCSGLLSLDATCNPATQSLFDGSEFILVPGQTLSLKSDGRHYFSNDQISSSTNDRRHISTSGIFVPSDTPVKYYNGRYFSTRCGSASDVSKFSFFAEKDIKSDTTRNILRGIFCSFIGLTASLNDNTLYTVKIPNYSTTLLKNYFSIRSNDNSPFYAVSDRYSIDTNSVDVYRGDCYTCTESIRLNRNFTDPEVPISEVILNEKTWADHYKGYGHMVFDTSDPKLEDNQGNFASMNRADINAVALGMWVTYKCLSNYNTGLRSVDGSHADEVSLMGNERSFYPLNNLSISVSNKIEESKVLNSGYSSTLGHRRNLIAENVPYIKELFDNRIAFSNLQLESSFENGYRIFQGLSYKDIDRQYGAIVKLLPWQQNLLCVFEHGIGLLPVNERALIQSEGASIHMYGDGVLQSQFNPVSDTFGSIWQESIIKTPVGVYGVDTYGKKIWRVSPQKGFETISDMRVQRFLNDNIKLSESDKYPIVGIRNVKTHYNNYKGDVMFTFYNEREDAVWNLCFNERLGKWITRYSWTPLYSENINNIFYSLDQKRAHLMGHIYNNLNCTYGIHSSPEWVVTGENSTYSSELKLVGCKYSSFSTTIKEIRTSFIENGEEQFISITNSDEIESLFTISGNTITSKPFSKFKEYFSSNSFIEKYGSAIIPPVYYLIYTTNTYILGSGTSTISTNLDDILGVILNYNIEGGEFVEEYLDLENKFLKNGFYIHGRAGIFDEIKYEDENMENQILPTKWYERQEPFEFEFVVNGELGLHKIFDNLVIISNNVQPKEIEYEIDGDVYGFNKAGIFKAKNFKKDSYIWDETVNKPKIAIDRDGVSHKYQSTQVFKNCKIEWDTVLNSYSLVVNQECKDIRQYGRRLGNIHYKEDSWYLNIEPIKYSEKYRVDNVEDPSLTNTKETRIRDKYVKIRVKYSGKDVVIITLLKTLLTTSYA